MGGWHSDRDLHLWEHSCIQLLLWEIGAVHTAWANINGRGAFNKPHVHQGPFQRSGVYFVAGTTGELAFSDGTVIAPEPGLLVEFPSMMQHWVRQNESEELRITVAFNRAV